MGLLVASVLGAIVFGVNWWVDYRERNEQEVELENIYEEEEIELVYKCSDSDMGINDSVLGFVISETYFIDGNLKDTVSYSDQCVSSIDQNNNIKEYAREYYCGEDNFVGSAETFCDNGCIAGTCILEEDLSVDERSILNVSVTPNRIDIGEHNEVVFTANIESSAFLKSVMVDSLNSGGNYIKNIGELSISKEEKAEDLVDDIYTYTWGYYSSVPTVNYYQVTALYLDGQVVKSSMISLEVYDAKQEVVEMEAKEFAKTIEDLYIEFRLINSKEDSKEKITKILIEDYNVGYVIPDTDSISFKYNKVQTISYLIDD